MPGINKKKYTEEERQRYEETYCRLQEMNTTSAPDAAKLRGALDEELAAGFPIDFKDEYGWTLLHYAVNAENCIEAGRPQILIKAGAELNVTDPFGTTPLGHACEKYICYDEPEYMAAIDALLAAGARHELDESWRNDWADPDERARRDWLITYIDTWPARRAARGRAEDAVPGFDYAL